MRRPEDVVRLIEECFQRLVADLRLDEAHRLLERLAQKPPERARKLMRSTIGRMVDPDRLAPLHDAVELGSEARPEIGRLLARMSPFVCETVCVFMERSTQEPTRRFYADLLIHMGKASLQPVLDHFPTSSGEARWSFVRVLGRLRAPEAAAPLLRALTEGDAPLRREIARSLAMIRTPQALAALLDLGLDDSDRRTRVIALRGLGEARAGLDPHRLLERIRSGGFAGLGDEEKDLLFGALGGVAGDAAVPFLRELLSPAWYSLRKDPAGWERAARALAAIGTPAAREALEAGAASRRREIADACGQALGSLGKEAPA
jgi:HEAT repeat protein